MRPGEQDGLMKRTISDFFFRLASIFKNAAAKVFDGGRTETVHGDLVEVDRAPAAKKLYTF